MFRILPISVISLLGLVLPKLVAHMAVLLSVPEGELIASVRVLQGCHYFCSLPSSVQGGMKGYKEVKGKRTNKSILDHLK